VIQPALRPFQPSDDEAVDRVVASAFGRRGEADLVRALRREADPFVEWIAESPTGVAGHVGFSPVTPERVGPGVRAMGLAPLSVEPALQRSGIGLALGRAGLADCAARGTGLVFVLGHAAYYPRLGFRLARELGFRYRSEAFDGSFFVLELAPGAASGGGGLVQFHPAFDRF
jgi:putative acetyltransferase